MWVLKHRLFEHVSLWLLPWLLAGCFTFYDAPVKRGEEARWETASAVNDRAQPTISTVATMGPYTSEPAEQPSSDVAGPLGPAPKYANLSRAACLEGLRLAGVAFDVVSKKDAHGIDLPIRVPGALAGVRFETASGSALHGLLDCRLALALAHWAPALRRAGVERIEHYSIFRPKARIAKSGKPSGHSKGLALDAARFHLTDGRVLDVLDTWQPRDRGSAPCPERPGEDVNSRILRSVVCQAVDAQLFQVVLTPHHNRAHANHVHLEIKPNVDWTYVR